MSDNFTLRPIQDFEKSEYADMLYGSFNFWYWKHGWGKDYFCCASQETSIFYELYNDLTPGCNVAAFDKDTGRMTGACFYHPREYHVSLGIMCVHQNYCRKGVGRLLVNHILDFTRRNDYKSCRLISSAINMDSLSLYNRSGFIPRVTYHDMVIKVPDDGLGENGLTRKNNVHDARLTDIHDMGELELEIGGIKREIDYRYAIENPRGVLNAKVYKNDRNSIEGFMISIKHPALNMLGPCVARTEDVAIDLIKGALNRFRGASVLFIVPVEKRKIVKQMYVWNAKNVETHLMSVWGEFPGFNGVNMPSFLPETG